MISLKSLVEAINDAAEVANATLAKSEDQVINNFFFFDDESGRYNAKTVAIEYPTVSKDGKMSNLSIDVPLITIVPISSARVEELRFTTDLDVAIDDDAIYVSFAKNNGEGTPPPEGKTKGASTRLELVIRPQENTHGLEKLIEGYEKLLRSQIPG